MPDTDNLITISKLYGVSLDALVGNVSKEASCAEETVNIEVSSVSDEKTQESHRKTSENSRGAALRILYALPYPVLVTVIFFLWGFLWDGWAVAWTLFVTIPIYPTVLDCIRTKRLKPFAYPVFITFLYLFIGMQWNLWHPWWILFVTIPIFYAVVDVAERK